MPFRLGVLVFVLGALLPGCGHFPYYQAEKPAFPRSKKEKNSKPAPTKSPLAPEFTQDQPPPRPGQDSHSKSNPSSRPEIDAAAFPLPRETAPPPVMASEEQENPISTKVKPAGFVQESTSLTGLPFPNAEKEDTQKPEPLVEALRCVLENRHTEALKHLQRYDQPTQELFLRILPVMAVLSQKGIDQLSPPEIAVLNEQLHGLLVTLRPRTDLTIAKMCYCDWVKAFGIYKPRAEGAGFLTPNASRPGELVQLYVELRNFANELQNGWYTTRLSSTVEIHETRDPAAKPIWFYRFDDQKHPLKSRTMLHDYFNNYSFYVPNIPPGSYLLTITVADETHPDRRRVARKSLEFRVTAVPPPAN